MDNVSSSSRSAVLVSPTITGAGSPGALRADTTRVLRNTYALLSMTLLFSAAVAGASVAFGLPAPGILLTLVGYFGLLFLVHKLRDRAAGIGAVFALTGFMGYTLGPVLTRTLSLPDGGQVIEIGRAHV